MPLIEPLDSSSKVIFEKSSSSNRNSVEDIAALSGLTLINFFPSNEKQDCLKAEEVGEPPTL
ncbi:hypothetical protein ACYU0W_12660 [Acinetobacter sp. X5]